MEGKETLPGGKGGIIKRDRMKDLTTKQKAEVRVAALVNKAYKEASRETAKEIKSALDAKVINIIGEFDCVMKDTMDAVFKPYLGEL